MCAIPAIGSRWQNRKTAEVITVESFDGQYAVVRGEHERDGNWQFLVAISHFEPGGNYFPAK